MTRTLCTHSCDKRLCKQYHYSPYSKGFHEATGSTAVLLCGQKTKSLPRKLESDNVRQMGTEQYRRFSNPLHQSASTRALAKPSYFLRRAKLVAAGGGESTFREGCHHQSGPSTSRKFLLNSLPCPQKRRPDETGHQPQEIERVGGTPTLQNEGDGDTQRIVEGKRLDGEDRPQRCLLHHSDSLRSSTISEVQGEPGTLPVHLPALRPIMCPMGVHQGDEANSYLPTGHGSTYDSLYR